MVAHDHEIGVLRAAFEKLTDHAVEMLGTGDLLVVEDGKLFRREELVFLAVLDELAGALQEFVQGLEDAMDAADMRQIRRRLARQQIRVVGLAGVDEEETRIGIREIKITKDAFLINSQKKFLRGINRHGLVGRPPSSLQPAKQTRAHTSACNHDQWIDRAPG